MRVRIVFLALAVALFLALVPMHEADASFGVTHCVKPGETLYSIAGMYGTSVWAISHVNGIQNPNYIRAYQCLTIPTGHHPMPPIYHPPPVYYPPPVHPSCAPGYYQVQSGDTLFAIGRYFRVSPWSIASANGLANPHLISIGQCLYIPRW